MFKDMDNLFLKCEAYYRKKLNWVQSLYKLAKTYKKSASRGSR